MMQSKSLKPILIWKRYSNELINPKNNSLLQLKYIKYQGMWYEIYRFESQSKRFGCATMLYVLNANANGYTVYNSYTNLRSKLKMQIEGTANWAIPNDPKKVAILDIKYPKKGKIFFKRYKKVFHSHKNPYKKTSLFLQAYFLYGSETYIC